MTLLRDAETESGDDEHSVIASRELPLIIVVDSDCRIVFEADAEAGRTLDPDIIDVRKRRLAPRVARLVVDVVAAPPSARGSRRLIVPPNYVVTATRIFGLHHGPVTTLSFEQIRSREDLSRAATTFALTAREAQILSLVLDGASALEVAGLLHLADTTVHGYFKRLLGKTASRNRSAMIAKVLGWRPRTNLQDR